MIDLSVSSPGYVNEAGNPVTPGSVTATTSAPTTQPPQPQILQPEADIRPAAPLNLQYPCELSVSQTSVPGFVCKGQLLFEDNFKTGIDKGKIWTPEIKFPGEPVSILETLNCKLKL